MPPTNQFQFEQQTLSRLMGECENISHEVMGMSDADCRGHVSHLCAIVAQLANEVQKLHKSHRATQFMVQE